MIPHKLIIKNFLSYGETPTVISFDGYQLICLSGKNGNGKSALLDALTWALWGQARKISGINKPDDGLLRLGSSRMLVTLEFSCENQMYRVRREYIKSGSKAVTALDLEVRQSHGHFSSLTDKTIRTTQNAINKIVGVDFETFVNSSFIRQGQSNEFSKKSPKERKEILSAILGLTEYQAIQSAALEKIRSLHVEQQMLTRLNNIASEEIINKESLTLELHKSKSETEKIKKEQSVHVTQKNNLTKEQQKKEQELAHYKLIETQVKALHEEYSALATKFQKTRAMWKELHQASSIKQNPEEKKERIQALEKKITSLQATQKEIAHHTQQQETLQKQIIKLQEEEQTKKDALQKKNTTLSSSISEQKIILEHKEQSIKKNESEIKKRKDLQSANDKALQTLSQLKQEYQALEKHFEKRKALYHTLVQKLQFIETNKEDLNQKKEQLASNDASHCPLCDQIVTAARKKFLCNNIEKQDVLLIHQKKRITQVLHKLKKLLLEQHPHLQKLQEEIQKLSQKEEENNVLIQEIKLFEKELSEIKSWIAEHDKKLKELLTEHKNIVKELETENKELTKQKTLYATIGTLIAQKNFNPDELTHAQELLFKEYQEDSANHQIKRESEKKILFSQAISLIEQLKTIKNKIKQNTHELNKQSILTQEILELSKEIKIIETNIEKSIQESEHHLVIQTKITNELVRIEKLEKESKQRLKTIESINEEVSEYQTIAQAFSKNGIPALLIEEVIPEIESEANLLLQKLTNNQAQIFIESVRDLKKGGVKETLDIHISDSAGIRPYEMFSGGEAFRIDFALRIAISKLLARRAGATLQTLIIDEGFGSQDEEGLQKIMDALYKIQNDFAKIIIVSHLPLMKDNFPVHFIIEKTGLGSQVRIEERG